MSKPRRHKWVNEDIVQRALATAPRAADGCRETAAFYQELLLLTPEALAELKAFGNSKHWPDVQGDMMARLGRTVRNVIRSLKDSRGNPIWWAHRHGKDSYGWVLVMESSIEIVRSILSDRNNMALGTKRGVAYAEAAEAVLQRTGAAKVGEVAAEVEAEAERILRAV